VFQRASEDLGLLPEVNFQRHPGSNLGKKDVDFCEVGSADGPPQGRIQLLFAMLVCSISFHGTAGMTIMTLMKNDL
jgi:hypothetical protein